MSFSGNEVMFNLTGEEKKSDSDMTQNSMMGDVSEADGDLRGVMIFYIDCSLLNHEQTNQQVNQIADDLTPSIERINEEGFETMFIPVKSGGTRVELLKF